MQELQQRFFARLKNVRPKFKRYLYPLINWENKLISITGARGTGKTTLLLQHIKEKFVLNEKVLYISLDDVYFQGNSLIALAEKFHINGGTHLFIDEVHKYPNWSIEIKTLYDSYADLYLVFNGSSILEINKGDADLSRRAVNYDLKGLSFREFLQIENKAEFPVFTLENLLQNHVDIAFKLSQDLKPIPLFKAYLQYGYYPFYQEGKEEYFQKLNNVMNLILETDLPSVYKTEFATIYKLKKLLYVLSTSVPYYPNTTDLASQLDTSRSSVLQYINYLEKARLIAPLSTYSKGGKYLAKPDKIYLDNSNLMFALGNETTNIGSIRETFFFNQIKNIADTSTSKEADFLVGNKYTFEIGGKNKTKKQIQNLNQAFVVLDDIEIGHQNSIPLWLFGLLY